jgi:hypothetical protein
LLKIIYVGQSWGALIEIMELHSQQRASTVLFGRLAHCMKESTRTRVGSTDRDALLVCCNAYLGIDSDPDDIIDVIPLHELPFLPNHRPAGTTSPPVATLYAKECAEPASYADALSGPHAHEWTAAVQH